jgi:uncharacterized protein YukE
MAFQEIPLPPVSLGPWGIALYTVVAVGLLIVIWRQRNWKSTSDAAVIEMTVHEKAADRLRKENQALSDANNKLTSLTSLQPLMEIQRQQTDLIGQWVSEGRARFESAQTALAANTHALTELVTEIKSQRTTAEDSFRHLSNAFIGHDLEDKRNQAEQAGTQLKLVQAISQLEQRMSNIAVTIGMHEWAPPAEKKRTRGTT